MNNSFQESGVGAGKGGKLSCEYEPYGQNQIVPLMLTFNWAFMKYSIKFITKSISCYNVETWRLFELGKEIIVQERDLLSNSS